MCQQITPGSAQEWTICGAGGWTWVSCMQSECLCLWPQQLVFLRRYWLHAFLLWEMICSPWKCQVVAYMHYHCIWRGYHSWGTWPGGLLERAVEAMMPNSEDNRKPSPVEELKWQKSFPAKELIMKVILLYTVIPMSLVWKCPGFCVICTIRSLSCNLLLWEVTSVQVKTLCFKKYHHKASAVRNSASVGTKGI